MTFAAAARAMEAGDPAQCRDLLRGLFRGARIQTIRAAGFYSLDRYSAGDLPAARALAGLVGELFPEMELRDLPRLNRLIIDSGFTAPHQGTIGMLRQVELVVELPALAPLLSMERNGYMRQAALGSLARSGSPRDLAAIVLRIGDYVEPVRSMAEDALRPWDRSILLEAWAVLYRIRSANRVSRIVNHIFTSVGTDTWRAGLDHNEEEVRALCSVQLLEREVDPLPILGRMLGARDSRVRRAACDRALSSEELRDALVPRLLVDSDPFIRGRAVQARGREADPDHRDELIRACFDRDSTVRHLARQALAKSGGGTDLRSRALRILKAPLEVPESDLVGALAVLADLGRAEDTALVRSFFSSTRPIAREARRTSGILETL